MQRTLSFFLAIILISGGFSGCSFWKSATPPTGTATESFPSRDRALVKKAFMKKYNVALAEVHVDFIQQTEKYIRGAAQIGTKNSEDKKNFIAALNGMEWQIIADNGVLPCKDLEKATVPAEMMTGCQK